MPDDEGRPPRGGWAPLAPELLVRDIDASLGFWCEALGFRIACRRPEQGFAYLEHADGAQLMLCRRGGFVETGLLEAPFGRGVMFQLLVAALEPVIEALARIGATPAAGPCEVWRRHGDRQGGRREITVQDPDGYLVLVAEAIGERALA